MYFFLLCVSARSNTIKVSYGTCGSYKEVRIRPGPTHASDFQQIRFSSRKSKARSVYLGVIHKLCNRLRGEGGLLNCSCLSTWGEGGFVVCLHSLFLSLFWGRGSVIPNIWFHLCKKTCFKKSKQI